MTPLSPTDVPSGPFPGARPNVGVVTVKVVVAEAPDGSLAWMLYTPAVRLGIVMTQPPAGMAPPAVLVHGEGFVEIVVNVPEPGLFSNPIVRFELA